jgi:hypothetical protein
MWSAKSPPSSGFMSVAVGPGWMLSTVIPVREGAAVVDALLVAGVAVRAVTRHPASAKGSALRDRGLMSWPPISTQSLRCARYLVALRRRSP